MKKLVIRIATIAAAFLLGVAGMSYFLMAGNTDSTAEMTGATLPLIYMERQGRNLNLLHGYTKSMDAATIRDAVYPLPSDRPSASGWSIRTQRYRTSITRCEVSTPAA